MTVAKLSSSRIVIEMADHRDDRELVQLMADIPMPGRMQFAYRREPSFLDALTVHGRVNQTVIGREQATGKIVGLGTRSIKPVFVNGNRMNIGYLSNLRVLEDYRRSTYLPRGYRKLKELHQDGQAPLYLSTMFSDNSVALRLTNGRAGLPAYHDYGQFASVAVSLSQRTQTVRNGEISIRSATHADLPLLVQFLNHEGKRRQFFPSYSEEDFCTDGGLLCGLAPEDILMAFASGRLVGVVAAWNQKSFRNTTVLGYTCWLRLLRPLYNLWARVVSHPVLPSVGSTLDYVYLSLVCIREDSQVVLISLLEELMQRQRGRHAVLMVGMHERDPLLPVMSRYRHLVFNSRLFLVCWDDGEELREALYGRCPYLELGAL
jgi:hypothetical protein